MLGTLSKKKKNLLREELSKRHKEGRTRSDLERRFQAAFTVKVGPTRYLADLLDEWEKRSFGS